MELYTGIMFTSVNFAICTDELQCLPNFIECLDKENGKCLSSALVLNVTVLVVFDENYSVLGKSKTR